MKTLRNLITVVFFLSLGMAVITSCDDADNDLQPSIELNEEMLKIEGDDIEGGDGNGGFDPTVNP